MKPCSKMMFVARRKKLGYLLLALLVALGIMLGSNMTPRLSGIEASYEIITYGNDKNYFSELTLTNNGWFNIDAGPHPVTVYVCFVRLVVNSDKASGFAIKLPINATVYHLDGCAHKIVYHSPFKLAVGENISITLVLQYWSIAYSDCISNWYIQLGDGPHQLITNTGQDSTQFVYPFNREEQYMRTKDDTFFPLTLEERYADQTKLNVFADDVVKSRLIPDIFQSMIINEKTEFIYPYFALTTSVVPVTYITDSNLVKDQFMLMVEKNGKVVVGVSSDSTKVKKMVSNTLKQLLYRFSGRLPIGSYKSKAPRFDYRGYMLDLARHYLDKEVLKRQIRLLRRYNLNVLHLHLIDDEAWALEIEDIPELTEYGSRQCFNLSQCANYPQLGRRVDSGKQYLSKAQYIEVVRYAESHGITVIPEIELPGHSTAAIQSMKLRYKNSPTKTDYRLQDPQDRSRYSSVQSFTKGAMNPCIDTMYSFIETVIKNIQRYHVEAGQPITILHLGGDEVSDDAWTLSPACRTFASNLGTFQSQTDRISAIKIEMMKQLGGIAGSLGVSLGFWEDGLMNKSSGKPMLKEEVFPNSVDVYAYMWMSVWEWWGGDRPYSMANGGYKVVLAPATHYYMDHAQEPHPSDRGFYWATRYVNLRKTFSFRADNYYGNIDGKTIMGDYLTKEKWCSPKRCPPLYKEENIVGVEAVLFGETVSTQEHIDNNVYPRMLAVADRAWNVASWEKLDGEHPDGLQEDFDLFRRSAEQYEIPLLEQEFGVKYHLSPPGAIEEKDGKNIINLRLSVEFKGQRVWWKPRDSKGSSSWTEAVDLVLPNVSNMHIDLRASNADGTRHSFTVSYESTKNP